MLGVDAELSSGVGIFGLMTKPMALSDLTLLQAILSLQGELEGCELRPFNICNALQGFMRFP